MQKILILEFNWTVEQNVETILSKAEKIWKKIESIRYKLPINLLPGILKVETDSIL